MEGENQAVTFRPGQRLPGDQGATKERTLYHQARSSGQLATMTREGGTWQWRQLHGNVQDGYGSGTWSEMQQWLEQG